MKCKNCGLEFNKGIFCPECRTKHEEEEKMVQETKKRFCKKCGQELKEGMVFCPNCGRRQDGTPDTYSAIHNVQGNQQSDKNERQNKNIFLQIWNSNLFTKVAIKFGHVIDIFEGIVSIILAVLLFSEDSFWGNVFGVLFSICGVAICIAGVMSLFSRKKENGGNALNIAAIKKKKRNLCIGVVLIIVALIVFANTGGVTYPTVQSVVFDNIGSESIGEIIDNNLRNPEWSQEKLDKDSKLVYVEGYCPMYKEKIRIEFYYEELKDGSVEVTLNSMFNLDDGDVSVGWKSPFRGGKKSPIRVRKKKPMHQLFLSLVFCFDQ